MPTIVGAKEVAGIKLWTQKLSSFNDITIADTLETHCREEMTLNYSGNHSMEPLLR